MFNNILKIQLFGVITVARVGSGDREWTVW